VSKSYPVYLVLHNIRSAENVGAIFRTVDAVGVEKIYLTGYTPRPIDKYHRPVQKIAKTALGAEGTVAWVGDKDINNILKDFKKNDINVVAVEQADNSVDYKNFKLSGPTAFIFGNEVLGLNKKLLVKCDQVVEIPMRGQKESLNVSVSVGVILFRVLGV